MSNLDGTNVAGAPRDADAQPGAAEEDANAAFAGQERQGSADEQREPSDLRIPCKGASVLRLYMKWATIELVGEQRDDIHIQGTSDVLDTLETYKADNTIEIRQEYHEAHRRMGWLPFHRHRPEGWLRNMEAGLEAGLRSMEAGLRVMRVPPPHLQVRVPETLARVETKTGMGSIQGRHLKNEVILISGAGDVRLEESTVQAEVHTGSGTVTLAAVGGVSVVHVGAGDVILENTDRARLTVNTGVGNIRLQGGCPDELKVHVGAGNIRGACRLGTGEFRLTTGVGNIHLELPADQAAQIDANTGMGQIDSEWPLVQVGRSGPPTLRSARMVGSIGEGPRAMLHLKTCTGNISLTRQTEKVATTPDEESPSPTEGTPSPTGAAPTGNEELNILERLARGEISVEQAEEMIARRENPARVAETSSP